MLEARPHRKAPRLAPSECGGPLNSQRERKLEVVDDKGMAVSAFDGDSVEKLFASTERDTIAVVDA